MKKLIPITLFAILSLVGCASSHDGAEDQFQRQEKRAHDCREMQDKLIANQSLTAARVDEITKTMEQAGCAAHLQAR
jgi:hypothetical protein